MDSRVERRQGQGHSATTISPFYLKAGSQFSRRWYQLLHSTNNSSGFKPVFRRDNLEVKKVLVADRLAETLEELILPLPVMLALSDKTEREMRDAPILPLVREENATAGWTGRTE